MPNFIEEIIEDDLASGRVQSVVTRFPPEPNGYLHIGHAKSICLNLGLAKKYGGVCNLRFDDTNPVKEDDEFVNSIVDDVKWLGWNGKVLYGSDYFDVMYECAVGLIRDGKAYVDDITPEQLKLERGTLTEPGIDSKHRNRPIEESLALFEKMKAGEVAEGALVLRAKIDMKSPNINMRDPIIYRVVHAVHHRQGDKWKIYPMYDFAHPIEDAVEGITHSICTLEFEDHRPLYDWVLDNCKLPSRPHQYEFARLNIERTIMSKRYLKKLVDDGVVEGWDDPRMPTIAGLRRRGYTPEALRDFCERIGVAKANSEVEAGQLESCIRDYLNETAPRVMAVLDPLKLVIVNRPDDYFEVVDLDNHPQRPEMGKRNYALGKTLYIDRADFSLDPPPKYHRLKPDGVVRLKGGYIVRYKGCDVDAAGVPQTVYAEIVEGTLGDNMGIKCKGVIQWVNAAHCVDIDARRYDYLLLPVTDGVTDFNERINMNSRIDFKAKAEEFVTLPSVDAFQFMRIGYFTRDSKDKKVFHETVSLKDSFNK